MTGKDLIASIRSANAGFAGKPALQESGLSLSFTALWEAVDEWVSCFRSHGIGEGKIVAIASANSVELAIQFLALLQVNASPLLIGKERLLSIRIKEKNVHTLILATADLSLADAAGVVAKERFRQSMIFFNPSYNARRKQRRLPAVLVTSSGTTQQPKIIMLSVSGIWNNIRANGKALAITEKDITLQILPLGYSYGLIGQFLTHLYHSATIVMAPPNSYLLHLSRYIKEYSITTLFTVPPILRQFLALRHPTGVSQMYISLRLLTIGGNHVEDYTIRKAMELFGCQIVKTYGLAEAGPRVCTNFLTQTSCEASCVGRPLENMAISVIGPLGNSLERGQTGRILVEGPSVALGYLNGKAPAIRAGKAVLTKDFGYLDDEGRLVVLGRKNEYLSVDKKKIWFSQVERAIYNTGKVCKVASSRHGDNLRLQLLLMSNQKLSKPDVRQLLRSDFGPDLAKRVNIEFMTAMQLKTFK